MIWLWSFNLYFLILYRIKEIVVVVVVGSENSVYKTLL